MVSIFGQGTMERENVGHGQHALQRGLLNAGGEVGSVFRSQGKHVHAQVTGDACHPHADMSESYDTHRLPGQLWQRRIPIAEVWLMAPFAMPVLFGIVSYLIGDVQYMRESHLHHAVGTIRGDIRHHDATPVGRFNVHHIITSGKHTDIFQFWQLGHHFVGDIHFIDQYGIGFLGALYHVFGGCSGINSEIAKSLECLPRQISGVGGIAVEFYNVHG